VGGVWSRQLGRGIFNPGVAKVHRRYSKELSNFGRCDDYLREQVGARGPAMVKKSHLLFVGRWQTLTKQVNGKRSSVGKKKADPLAAEAEIANRRSASNGNDKNQRALSRDGERRTDVRETYNSAKSLSRVQAARDFGRAGRLGYEKLGGPILSTRRWPYRRSCVVKFPSLLDRS